MNIEEAKRELKRLGKLDYRGVRFVETMKNGAYTGRYNVIVDSEVFTDQPVSLTESFEFAKKYFM